MQMQASSPRNVTRRTQDYEEDDFTGPNFIDHYSLRDPSSTVKFRGARVHVYNTFNEQILLEDRRSSKDRNNAGGDFDDDDDNGKNRRPNRHSITVKRIPITSFGLRVLRLAYSLIALLNFGYAFALSFQIILFLFVHLANEANIASNGSEDSQRQLFALDVASTLLSIPVFLFGFSSLMAIASTFVAEAWSGGFLIRAVFKAPPVVTELLYFVFFLLIPLSTFFSALYAGLNNPWEIATYAWLGCVAFVFCCFGLAVVWCEVSACFKLVSIHYGDDDGTELSSCFSKIRCAILLVQTHRYSGEKHEQYLVTDTCVPPGGGFTFSDKHDPTYTRKSIYSHIAQLGCFRFMYETIDPPERTYSIEEVLDDLRFITRNSWSLEGMFFSSSRRQKIISVQGPSALTGTQVLSTFACNIFGTILIIVTVISIFAWLSTGWASYIVVALISIVCCLFPLIQSQKTMIQMYRDIHKDDLIEEGGENVKPEGNEPVAEAMKVRCTSSGEIVSEETLYRLWESSRVVQPKPWVCYFGMLLECLLLILFPATVLFLTKNITMGVVFIIISFFSFLRYYFDPSAILCELGSMNTIEVEPEYENQHKKYARLSEERKLVLKARLAGTVRNITRSNAVKRWIWFFGTLVLATYFLFNAALASNDGLGERPPIVLVDDYTYPAEESLQYPSCSMSKGFKISVDGGEEEDTALGDYAYLAALAYETTDVTGYLLPQWFGEGAVIDEDTKVKEYREEANNSIVPVYFKLFTFPYSPDLAVLAIRGSQTSWDWMVNLQLWSASGLAQLVKWMIPYGWLWTPILDDLVWFISFIQSDQLNDVAYYKVTTDAVETFRESFEKIRVTGASLGGGLAIITGAQAKAPAIGISGLGVELSRNAVTPKVTMDDINKYVFNFMPDRDYIARIGGRPRQHQEAQCSAKTSNLFGCHSMWRSVCEINYRCGSNGRPVICRCHFNFGYPVPEPIGNTTRSFEEACYEEEQAFLNATGSTVTSGWW